MHEVRLGHQEIGQPWFKELLARVAGPNGYRSRQPFWAYTIISFATKQQADALELHLGRHREVARLREARSRPCPVAVRYEEAARAQHAVIWGLSTGLIREVVRTYRRARRDCSTHGYPNMVAAGVIVAAAPAIGIDRAREMVDAMLAWTIARHGGWFWTGLPGDRTLKLYA